MRKYDLKHCFITVSSIGPVLYPNVTHFLIVKLNCYICNVTTNYFSFVSSVNVLLTSTEFSSGGKKRKKTKICAGICFKAMFSMPD